MMSLNEAIKHAEEVANKCQNFVTAHKEDRELGFIQRTEKCADEHFQLAEWLRELKERRKKDNQIERGNARWLINSDGYYPYCSACMAEPKDGKMTDVCPSCGAKMEGKIT